MSLQTRLEAKEKTLSFWCVVLLIEFLEGLPPFSDVSTCGIHVSGGHGPFSQFAGVPDGGWGVRGKQREKAKGLPTSNGDLTSKSFSRFPTLTEPLS
jgi:hypothetical protein